MKCAIAPCCKHVRYGACTGDFDGRWDCCAHFIPASARRADTREGVRSKPLMGGGVPPPETARTGGEAGPDGRRRPSPPPIMTAHLRAAKENA